VEGDINDFLRVQIQRETNSFHFSQPHLVLDILKELRLEGEKTAVKQTPTASSRKLLRHMNSEPFDDHFNIR
jgi:hypothetical protein